MERSRDDTSQCQPRLSRARQTGRCLDTIALTYHGKHLGSGTVVRITLKQLLHCLLQTNGHLHHKFLIVKYQLQNTLRKKGEPFIDYFLVLRHQQSLLLHNHSWRTRFHRPSGKVRPLGRKVLVAIVFSCRLSV